MRGKNATLHGRLRLFEELVEMLRRRASTALSDWIARARASGSPELANLAESFGATLRRSMRR